MIERTEERRSSWRWRDVGKGMAVCEAYTGWTMSLAVASIVFPLGKASGTIARMDKIGVQLVPATRKGNARVCRCARLVQAGRHLPAITSLSSSLQSRSVNQTKPSRPLFPILLTNSPGCTPTRLQTPPRDIRQIRHLPSTLLHRRRRIPQENSRFPRCFKL